jgi:ribosomal protein S18 acetylase RimI-like enzyme
VLDKMGFLIREARIDDAEGIAKVHIDSWRTTYKGIVADDILDKLNVENRIERWKSILGNPSQDYRIIVAVDQQKQIIGFLDGGINREKAYDYDAEMFAFYLLEHVQKQGIGREMVKVLAVELQKMGLKSILVWVLKDNPARRFYEKLGGDYVDAKYLEGLRLDEVAYGWKDIGALTKKTTR